MDFPRVTTGGSIEEQKTPKSKKKERNYRRHSPNQIARLEEMFKKCPQPNVDLRRQLSEELGLELKQVKFWFQNKRTQVKTMNERSNNNVIRFENEKLQSENIILGETLKNVTCSSCRNLNSEEEEHTLTLQNLRLENAILYQEHERLSNIMREINGINPVPPPTLESSCDPSQESLLNHNSQINAPNNPTPHIFAPTPSPAFTNVATPSLDQNVLTYPIIPTTLDQKFSTITPELDQHFPTLPCIGTPVINQTYPNQNHPSLTHDIAPPTSENISALIYAIDQDISVFEQNNFALEEDILDLSPIHDQQIPTFDRDNYALNLDIGAAPGVLDGCMLPHPISSAIDMEKARMMELANNSMEELKMLLSMNEPFWLRSIVDGKLILQHEAYEKLCNKRSCLKGPHARIESSKDSQVVSMSGRKLVDMFLNSDKWVNLFPTIVKNAQTLQVFESSSSGSPNGTLQLMNTEMHILSPFVPIRQFVFLRYCKQIEVGVWVIADVSLDSSPYDTTPPRARKFPSGCMIHEITNESCRVSWVEHIQVDDKIQIDQLFRDVICCNNAYGAERWVLTLKRMCERFASASLESIPSSDYGGVISSAEGRRSMMKFAHRMIKIFCGTLHMTDNIDFPHLNELNNGRFRICARKSTDPDTQDCVIVGAATSFWLPISPQNVFNFLKDNNNRLQWDVLCNANPVHEIQHITSGTNLDNFTSIIRPFVPKDNDMLILQECCMHPLEYLFVYAPIDIATLNSVIKGEDSSLLHVLPSGFTITRDSRLNSAAEQSEKLEGSLVTLTYQVLSTEDMLDMDFISSVNSLVSTTMEKIKLALNCSNLD